MDVGFWPSYLSAYGSRPDLVLFNPIQFTAVSVDFAGMKPAACFLPMATDRMRRNPQPMVVGLSAVSFGVWQQINYPQQRLVDYY